MPNFRLVLNKDYDVLYEIWMQDHVNPFMSFEIMSREAFRPIFDLLCKTSDVYVLEVDSKIVAVRRIIYGKGINEHVAYFGSFGVHKDYLGRGYGKQFYAFLIGKIRNEKKHIKRIELMQESDNLIAFSLAQKMGFKVEAVTAEGAIRSTGTHKEKWHVGSRFMAILLDPETERGCAPLKPFTFQLPSLIRLKNIDFDQLRIIDASDRVYCYYDSRLQVVCNIDTGIGRYSHIQYWSVMPEVNFNPIVVAQFLRIKAVEASHKFKKIEVLVSDSLLLEGMAELGFHYCGQKIVSRKLENNYYNEAYFDLSFFNIEDARNVVKKQIIKDEYKFQRILTYLNKCHTAIKQAFREFKIDEYGCLYLENLAFQMIREEFGEIKLYNQVNAPWKSLISYLPVELGLKDAFIDLQQLIYKKPLIEIKEKILQVQSKVLPIESASSGAQDIKNDPLVEDQSIIPSLIGGK